MKIPTSSKFFNSLLPETFKITSSTEANVRFRNHKSLSGRVTIFKFSFELKSCSEKFLSVILGFSMSKSTTFVQVWDNLEMNCCTLKRSIIRYQNWPFNEMVLSWQVPSWIVLTCWPKYFNSDLILSRVVSLNFCCIKYSKSIYSMKQTAELFREILVILLNFILHKRDHLEQTRKTIKTLPNLTLKT